MTTLGWSAFGSLTLHTSSQSGTMLEALCYVNLAIAVCTVVAALIVLTGPAAEGAVRPEADIDDDDVQSLRTLAGQLRCSESRARVLALVERLH
jgi:hypothetical protein